MIQQEIYTIIKPTISQIQLFIFAEDLERRFLECKTKFVVTIPQLAKRMTALRNKIVSQIKHLSSILWHPQNCH